MLPTRQLRTMPPGDNNVVVDAREEVAVRKMLLFKPHSFLGPKPFCPTCSQGRRLKKTISVTIEYEDELVPLIDRVAKARGTTRSQIIRQWTLEGLARLSYLPEDTKKALGFLGKP